jgi:DmsE family decaheme c-type cytochrome
MKQWQRIIAVCAASVGLGLLVSSTPVLAADAPKAAVEKKEAAKDLFLKGDARCTACHDEADAPNILHMARTRHGVKADGRTPTCTSCHGESDDHAAYKGSGKPPAPTVTFGKNSKASAEARNGACLTCHEADGKRMLWSGSQHESREVVCSSCHQMHTQNDRVMTKATQTEVCYTCHKTQRAESHKTSTHPIAAGKVVCSSCHNPHGSTGPKLLVKNTVNQTCYTCHAEKRGPFLWEHSPSADDCTNCHTTHGSNTAPLLKARLPFLCQECHQDHGSTLKSGASVMNGPGQTSVGITGLALGKQPSVQGNGRMCVNCHVMIHGSNAPNGGFFNR